ncbi:hypothetical protein QE375_001215 [Microbacterium foliorum]|uniref:Uncharacterized protein n=1 Tax=Microbacterium foliorum TaxID=104336 RepID=A0ABU1HNQ8_9MICO|nr:hypothetical protein [Microbacterium foliorum]
MIRPVADARAACAARRLADDPELALVLERRELRVRSLLAAVGEESGLATVERHRVGLAAAVDLDVEALGEGIDDGSSDAVQTPGSRVGPAAELAAGVQLREDDLDAGQARARLDVDGDAPATVVHLDAAVIVQDDVDLRAVARDGLVDGVVDDLPEAVHQARGSVRTDVHTGTLADGLEPFEHLEMMGGILGGHNLRVYSRCPGCSRRHSPRTPTRRPARTR